jgi:outer membrane biosynthesis protein TonB
MSNENSLKNQMPTVLNLVAALVLFSVGIASADINDREGRLVAAGPPIYPQYCFRKGLQGYVDLVFVVDVKGLAQDLTIVDAIVYRKVVTSPVNDERAKRAFISAAKTALGNYRYEPPIRNGQAVETEGVKTRINFKLER